MFDILLSQFIKKQHICSAFHTDYNGPLVSFSRTDTHLAEIHCRDVQQKDGSPTQSPALLLRVLLQKKKKIG